MKSLIYFLLLGAIFTYCTAPQPEEDETQEETFLFVQGHQPVWENAIGQVKALVDSMPEDQLSYRPDDSIRTFAEQIVHIATSSKFITNLYLKDERPSGGPDLDIPSMTKEDLKNLVDSELTAAWDIIATMSDQALQDSVTSFRGNQMTRLEGVLTVHDHLTNHKAKANLYIRMTGNNPPAYGYY